MRLAITGSRRLPEEEASLRLVDDAVRNIERCLGKRVSSVTVAGASPKAQGADAAGAVWALVKRRLAAAREVANWAKHGRAARRKSDERLLRSSDVLLLVLVRDEAGWGLPERARALGLPVWLVRVDEATFYRISEGWYGVDEADDDG